MIEYDGPLDKREGRETLIERVRRPRGKPCLGLLWVEKTDQHEILAFCPACGADDALVTGWEGTYWAGGPMPAKDLGAPDTPVDAN